MQDRAQYLKRNKKTLTVKNQNYTGINWGCAFLAKILFNIRIITSKIGQSRSPQAPRKHAHTMTQGEAFMICMKSICLLQPLRHQHSTSK
jgi:hypothetical protein